MTITASQVKELREKTGAGMMDAKNALVEANGDMDKAAEVLRQKGIATAEKKSGRAAADGQVEALVSDDRKKAVLVEVNCETDFVAKGDAFLGMVRSVTQHVMKHNPASVEALLEQPSDVLSGKSVRDYVTDQVASIKENLSIRRFVNYQLPGPGAVHSYIHTGGRIGVLVEISAEKDDTTASPEFQQLLKDLSMQIASAAPEFVDRSAIPAEVIAEETRVEMGKEDLQNKPEDIRRKIVEGRVSKLMGQRCLLEQPFVKDPGQSVDDLLRALSVKLGDNLNITRFTRYVLGEGIEKKETNFAEEVAAAAKG